MEATVASYCFHEHHMLPSAYLRLPRREKAFITAVIELRAEAARRAAKEQKKKGRRWR